MLRKLCCFFSLPAFLCLSGIRASAQANISENPTSYIYVDAANGSDGNSGTADSPLQTIQAAVDQADSANQQGVGVKVIVKPGVYRESVNIGNYRSTGAVLILEAAATGTAILSGSDVLSGWNSQGNGVYTHPWSANFGNCPVPSGWPTTFAEIARRTEMLYVNGTPLTQVMSTAQLKPGTFFASEGSNTIYAYPDASVDMNSATVEAAMRPQTLNIAGRSNVVIRGLAFRHAASCVNTTGVNVYGSSNVLFDFVQASWNNWVDVIIDDGSHISKHAIFTFRHLFPYLAEGGLYFVEDTQTSYWADWGGNETERNDPSTTMGFFKALADGLNWMEFNGEYSPTYLDTNVQSISFFHNLIAIRKGPNREASYRPEEPLFCEVSCIQCMLLASEQRYRRRSTGDETATLPSAPSMPGCIAPEGACA